MANDPREQALYTATQVRLIDQVAISRLHIPGPDLMRRAARAAYALLRRRWPQARRLLVLAGGGNNGGDAFEVASLALHDGLAVEVLALTAASTGDAAVMRAGVLAAGGAIRVVVPDGNLPEADVCVDGLFGSGLARDVDGVARGLIEQVNASGVPVLALDVPSGLDADRGMPRAVAMRAAATICFVGWKRGLFTAQGAEYCGARELASLDIPQAAYEEFAPAASLLDEAIFSALPRRRAHANKGDCGHVLVVGGDHGFGGAVQICASAALRSGAGLVSVATHATHVGAINAGLPEAMALGVEEDAELEMLLARASVIALGPGLGQSDWSHHLFAAALAAGKPGVVDADALNLLAQAPRELGLRCVITPHPGEAARLLGCGVQEVQADRFESAKALARRFNAMAVLKGSGSLIAAPDGRIAVCGWGNPGMASGGMGDLLTGVIAALLAQGLDAWNAACVAVAAHARAGDLAAAGGERGLIASDLLPHLRALLNGKPA